ncbi:hypothetical protein DNTS_015425 [Danionella cerebrum]|uniref:BHLH domain-containing protein n=1 Tax=Danionella cerebrum TaxID=2873325 RepID=A0A553R401_9TELE|nr:hypothetical protein DNTS_015425 [Danionella translucida]
MLNAHRSSASRAQLSSSPLLSSPLLSSPLLSSPLLSMSLTYDRCSYKPDQGSNARLGQHLAPEEAVRAYKPALTLRPALHRSTHSELVMSPNSSSVAALSLQYTPRTVAMRKEANELRRSLKPLLEKKRRARINDSLGRLKALILPLTGKDSCRYSKLEKADILEMTVRFLTEIQTSPVKESSVSFQEGYTACLQRVSARIPHTSLDAETRGRIGDFIQGSMKPKSSSCQNCCAQSSRMISQIQQKLLHLKSRSATSKKSSSELLGEPQPAPHISEVWRPCSAHQTDLLSIVYSVSRPEQTRFSVSRVVFRRCCARSDSPAGLDRRWLWKTPSKTLRVALCKICAELRLAAGSAPYKASLWCQGRGFLRLITSSYLHRSGAVASGRRSSSPAAPDSEHSVCRRTCLSQHLRRQHPSRSAGTALFLEEHSKIEIKARFSGKRREHRMTSGRGCSAALLALRRSARSSIPPSVESENLWPQTHELNLECWRKLAAISERWEQSLLSLSKIMRPDDANIVGNVHGGTILKMIEEAGCIIGTRHCNTQTGDRCVAALARVERTDFLHPMFIGEVAHVSAGISYTSKHSVEVQVSVVAENIVTDGASAQQTQRDASLEPGFPQAPPVAMAAVLSCGRSGRRSRGGSFSRALWSCRGRSSGPLKTRVEPQGSAENGGRLVTALQHRALPALNPALADGSTSEEHHHGHAALHGPALCSESVFVVMPRLGSLASRGLRPLNAGAGMIASSGSTHERAPRRSSLKMPEYQVRSRPSVKGLQHSSSLIKELADRSHETSASRAKKMTNKATLWYVPVSLQNVDKIIEVPPIEFSRPELEEAGRKRYEAQKLDRIETRERNGDIVAPVSLSEPHTVACSQSSLIHLIGPSDCSLHGFVDGGTCCSQVCTCTLSPPSWRRSAAVDVCRTPTLCLCSSGVTMKLMDEVAGIVAARHCKTNIVTASVDAINFHRKIRKGCVVTVSGRMTFTSNKSMEIEVFVDADPLVEAEKGKYRAVSAFFTYISLDRDNKALAVPPLKLEGEEELRRFEQGKARYLQNKAKRLAEKER